MLPASGDLLYFIEVAQTLNLSRAAERLGVSQPTLSLSLKRLEESVGISLFVRSTKGVVLTPAGKKLLGGARSLLEEWGQLASSARRDQDEVTGRYRLGCHASVALYTLPFVLPELLKEFPELDVSLAHDLSRRIAEDVISLRLDLGLVINPVEHPDLVIQPLFDDEVTFWTLRKPTRHQDVTGDDAVLICDPDLLQTQHLLKSMSRAGLKFRRVIHSSSLEVITSLVAAGAGVGLLPGRVATRTPSEGIVRLPDAPAFKDRLTLVYRIEGRKLRSLQTIAAKIKSLLLKQK